MIFYILLTHGPKPSGNIRTHPAAKAQLAFIKRLVAPHPDIKKEITFDYARRVDGLESLPKLHKTLIAVKDIDGIKVRIDDLSRVFRVTNFTGREELLEDLQEFGSSLFSIKHQKLLKDFSDFEILWLTHHPEKSKLPAKQERTSDTSKARKSSLKSRRSRSILISQQLLDIKSELVDTEGKATLQMVAEAANQRGFQTSRGCRWTPQNVARILNLLE